jgi:Xaa-Pro aminopeptidase
MAFGLTVESGALFMLLKLATALLGLFLLGCGHRLPRFTGGLFWLLAAMGLALSRLAGTSYLLATVAALLLFFAFLWLLERLPRLPMAAASLLPLPLLWFAYIYFSGSFAFRPLVALLGALLGAMAGALWPRAMLAPLASVMGISLLAWALPVTLSFPMLAVPALLACALQLFDLHRLRARGRFNKPPRRPASAILKDWRKWAAAVAGVWLVLALFAPYAQAPDPIHGRRMALLTAATIEFSPERIFYLSGRGRPLALPAPRRSFFNRLELLISGRAQGRAIDKRRLVKEDDEIARIRRAGQVTALAMAQVPALARPGVGEREIQDAILAAFRRHGCPIPSFEPIVGSGAAATLPHYSRNNGVLQQGFVVVDIGCMDDGYAADMTRTFPVGGTCTPAQQKLLDVTAAAKGAAERILKPGVTMRQLDAAARRTIERAGFGRYFIHSVGHCVGINVHDPTPDVLAANMVVTLEPGIYIPHGADVDPAYWDLGVRIEDTYRVTADGYEILTLPPPPARE